MIVGIDEAGRGCWAGPLVAAAVLLDQTLPGLADSKKLSRLQRLKLYDLIHSKAASFGVGVVTPAEVDSLGLTAATTLAMTRAMDGIQADYEQVIIDGNLNYLPEHQNVVTIIKADATVPAVSAASILAKVTRDNLMLEAAAQYPDYGFDKHVGYGTALHLAQLKLHGLSPIHRLSYKPVKQFLIVN